MLAVAGDGTIYVTQREPGTLTMLRDTDNDGIADVQKVAPNGPISRLYPQQPMYLASVKEVLVADIKPDGTLGPLQTLIKDLPDGGQHPTAHSPLARRIGCSTSRWEAPAMPVQSQQNPELATMLRAQLDGSERKSTRRVSGHHRLRLASHFKRMYGMDHGIDWLATMSRVKN